MDGDRRSPKYVCAFVMDSRLPNKVRAATFALKKFVQGFFSGVHVEVTIEHVRELDEAVIKKRLLAAGGAHAPSHFQF